MFFGLTRGLNRTHAVRHSRFHNDSRIESPARFLVVSDDWAAEADSTPFGVDLIFPIRPPG